MRKLLVCAAALGALSFAAPAGAITFGNVDGTAHPNVGALFADYDPSVPGLDLLCSGTLVSPTVFVTASHCTVFLPSVGVGPHDVWVSFDPRASDANGSPWPGATLRRGTYHTNPLFASGGFNNTYDIAVVVLDAPVVGITPAQLPTRNFLDTIDLKSQRFTAVGYGTVRDIKQTGPNALFFDGIRRWVDQGFNALNKSWLRLSMNPSTGNGGTCYGDSGGPHFLGTTNLLVALTVTGDAPCRSTDVDYRVDQDSARDFLAGFVALP
jgi:hypothetical protein